MWAQAGPYQRRMQCQRACHDVGLYLLGVGTGGAPGTSPTQRLQDLLGQPYLAVGGDSKKAQMARFNAVTGQHCGLFGDLDVLDPVSPSGVHPQQTETLQRPVRGGVQPGSLA